MGTPRPHKVFVFDIGEAYSYATAERADERARQLIADGYGKVAVWRTDRSSPWLRTIHTYDQPPRVERLSSGHWIPDPQQSPTHQETHQP